MRQATRNLEDEEKQKERELKSSNNKPAIALQKAINDLNSKTPGLDVRIAASKKEIGKIEDDIKTRVYEHEYEATAKEYERVFQAVEAFRVAMNKVAEGIEFSIDKVQGIFEALRDNVFQAKRIYVKASSNAIADDQPILFHIWVMWLQEDFDFSVEYDPKTGFVGLYSDAVKKILV